MAANQYDQELDIPQVLCLAFGAVMLLDGAQGILDADSVGLGDGAKCAVGGGVLVGAWLRNFRRVRYRTDVQKPEIPATNMDGGDRVVTWTTVIVLLALLLTSVTDEWWEGLGISLLIASVLLVIRLTVGRTIEAETFVLPVIALLGPIRIVFYPLGAYCLARSLDALNESGGHGPELLVAAIGVALWTLASVEQGFLTRRRRQQVDAMEPNEILPKLDAVIALLAELRALGEHPVREVPPPSLSPKPKGTRPLWLVGLVTVALLAFACYVSWKALDDTSEPVEVAPMVVAGLALVLAVMGERLSSLTFKTGTIEATLSDNAPEADPHGGTSGPAGAAPPEGDPLAPDVEAIADDEPIAPTTLDPASTNTALVVSLEGETVLETLARYAGGDPVSGFDLKNCSLEELQTVRLLMNTPGRHRVRRSQTPARRPTPEVPRTRTLTVKGPADDVKTILERMLE